MPIKEWHNYLWENLLSKKDAGQIPQWANIYLLQNYLMLKQVFMLIWVVTGFLLLRLLLDPGHDDLFLQASYICQYNDIFVLKKTKAPCLRPPPTPNTFTLHRSSLGHLLSECNICDPSTVTIVIFWPVNANTEKCWRVGTSVTYIFSQTKTKLQTWTASYSSLCACAH